MVGFCEHEDLFVNSRMILWIINAMGGEGDFYSIILQTGLDKARLVIRLIVINRTVIIILVIIWTVVLEMRASFNKLRSVPFRPSSGGFAGCKSCKITLRRLEERPSEVVCERLTV